jgi:hypothetical protein
MIIKGLHIEVVIGLLVLWYMLDKIAGGDK